MKFGFSIALILSILLHLMLFTASGWQLGSVMADDTQPLKATLVKRSVEVKKTGPVPGPATKKAAKKVQQPAPVPVPAASEAESTTIAGQEEPEELAEALSAEPVPDSPAGQMPGVDTSATDTPAAKAMAPEVPEIAHPLPHSGRIHYSVMRGEDGFEIGESIHEWRHDGKHYRISATSETTGIAAFFKAVKVVQVSEGMFFKGEMRPDSFRYDRSDDKTITATFDWELQRVTYGDGQVVPFTESAEDVLSMFYQLMQAAQHGQGFVMAVATPRKVERYAFEWLGEEVLDMKPGRIRAWHVRVRAESGGKDTTEVWLGQEVAGLPVKIRNTDRKGGVFDQVAEEIEYEGQ